MVNLQAAFSPSSSNRKLIPADQIAFLPAGTLTSCGVVISIVHSRYAVLHRVLNDWLVNANTLVHPASKLGAGISMS
jgi:hypothetical protein